MTQAHTHECCREVVAAMLEYFKNQGGCTVSTSRDLNIKFTCGQTCAALRHIGHAHGILGTACLVVMFVTTAVEETVSDENRRSAHQDSVFVADILTIITMTFWRAVSRRKIDYEVLQTCPFLLKNMTPAHPPSSLSRTTQLYSSNDVVLLHHHGTPLRQHAGGVYAFRYTRRACRRTFRSIFYGGIRERKLSK